MIVFVTEEDIKNGRRFISKSCPLALAMTRAFKDRAVLVHMSTFCFADELDEKPLPQEAIAFRRLFDADKKVSPFMFEVVQD